ncbi:MAG: oxidoreductase C-terminal domain-containing protein, partial [Actinomycetota bacterium]
VARAILEKAGPYDYMHSFWSDQYDHNIEYIGYADKWDEFVFREGDGLLGFYLAGGKIKAAMGLDRGGDPEADPDSELAACADLIRKQAEIDPSLLADNDAALPSLLPPG